MDRQKEGLNGRRDGHGQNYIPPPSAGDNYLLPPLIWNTDFRFSYYPKYDANLLHRDTKSPKEKSRTWLFKTNEVARLVTPALAKEFIGIS